MFDKCFLPFEPTQGIFEHLGGFIRRWARCPRFFGAAPFLGGVKEHCAEDRFELLRLVRKQPSFPSEYAAGEQHAETTTAMAPRRVRQFILIDAGSELILQRSNARGELWAYAQLGA
ncbi:MAG: hypothetical protein C0458_26685 [Methylobacterium sp.]|nr:hypothetical protein [Methylobacterium sp.]